MNAIPSQRLHILDSLRGLAALIVCIHHLSLFNNTYFKSVLPLPAFQFLTFISDQNLHAVLFFFVLSGFSIGLSMKRNSLDDKAAINNYLYRRFKRILPIYWFSLFISFICGLIIQKISMPDFSLGNLAGNLLFLQTSKTATNYWFSPYGLNGPLWSLAYEMFFYLSFIVLWKINSKYLFRTNVYLKLLLTVLITLLAIFLNQIIFVPYFAFTSLIMVWLLGYLNSQTFLYKRNFDFIYSVLFIGAIIYLFWLHKIISSDTVIALSKGITIASLFYVFIKLSQRKFLQVVLHIPKLVLNAVFSHIGKGSYALYALHYPLLLTFRHFNIALTWQILGLILLIIGCILIEEWSVKKAFRFLKFNYI